MHVLITGGTGFVGSHTVKSLMERGHTVRLFVRSRDRIPAALGPLGLSPPDDVVEGDVTDEAAVAAALEGCDAVVHSASVFTMDVRRAKELRETNAPGTRNVLGQALDRGLDPVIHVSSIAALVPFHGTHLTATSPLGSGLGPYTKSKAESERVAREYQALGKPVVTILPGGVMGPHDPHFGETHQITVNFLKGWAPMLPKVGDLPVVDVRDVADAIAAAMEAGRGPRAYLLAGHVMGMNDFASMLETVTGRKLRRMLIPTGMALASAPLCTGMQRISPWRLPMSSEGLRFATALDVRTVDDENVRTELGVQYRPSEETFRATVESLVETGRLGKEAGKLARRVQAA